MGTAQIEKKQLLELKTSTEIYEQKEVQRSLRRARKDVVSSKTRSFHGADEAIAWLKQ